MNYLNLSEYTPVINSIEIADKIFYQIAEGVKSGEVVVDFDEIRFISTNCAKHIFGRLFLSLGQELFFDRVILKNACDNVKVSINAGIESAIVNGSSIIAGEQK